MMRRAALTDVWSCSCVLSCVSERMIYCITSVLYKQCMQKASNKKGGPVEIVRLAASLVANWDSDQNPRPVVHHLQRIRTRNDQVEWHWSSIEPVNRHSVTPDTFDKSQTSDIHLGRRRYFQWSLSGACNELSICLLTAIHQLQQSGRSLTICGQPFGSVRFVKDYMKGFPNALVWDRFSEGWTEGQYEDIQTLCNMSRRAQATARRQHSCWKAFFGTCGRRV